MNRIRVISGIVLTAFIAVSFAGCGGKKEEVTTMKYISGKTTLKAGENDGIDFDNVIGSTVKYDIDYSRIAGKTDLNGEFITQPTTQTTTETTTAESTTTEKATTEKPETTTKAGRSTTHYQPKSTTAKTTKEADSKPASTTKPTTTEKQTTEKTSAAIKNKSTKVSTKTTKLKYGVVKIDTTETDVLTYADGSKSEGEKRTTTTYDRSGYNGTTGSLKNEAMSNRKTYSKDIQTVVAAVNSARKEAGASEVKENQNLSLAACIRALEMAWSGSTAQTRPNSNGKGASTVLDELNIKFVKYAEISAKGDGDAVKMGDALKSASGISNPDYKNIGVGLAMGPDGEYYWCIVFTY